MNALDEASAHPSAAAAERVAARTSQRREKIGAITTGRMVLADEPVRIASRIDRLSHYYPGVRPVSPSALRAGDPAAVAAAGAILERVINTPDFVDVRYLEAGTRASRAVGRVDIRNHAGRVTRFGIEDITGRCRSARPAGGRDDGQGSAAPRPSALVSKQGDDKR
jgi:endonuclease G, mitochondrial